jgi:NDMA-dependent alcohol dehydrogenase
MRTEAAICWGQNSGWSVETVELDPPKAGEMLVRMAAAGLCHTDEHLVTGDLPGYWPVIGGHEGAAIVAEVGPGVDRFKPGDHVVFGFNPTCGECPQCARGHSSLCDNGAILGAGTQLDGTSRHHARGQDLKALCCIGSFGRYSVVNQMSCVKVPDDIPLDVACLVSCGFTTGWGSAVYAAGIRPGEDVAVIGIGGIGAAAVQGARAAGAERIFAIDPVQFKREVAPRFGATRCFSSVQEALEPIREETWGRMCNKVICAMGVGQGSMMLDIMALVAKNGRAVITNIHPATETQVNLSLLDLTTMQKQIVGALFGSSNIRYDIPHLLEVYRRGYVDLDAMITSRYKLDEINQGYQDLRDGKNVRGVLIYE